MTILHYMGIASRVLGGMELIRQRCAKFSAVYAPIGNNKARVRILENAIKYGYDTPSFVHSSVVKSKELVMGRGVYILASTTIMPYVTLEDFVMISMSVNVAHHSILKSGTFLSTGVNFGASIVAEKYSYVGIASTIVTKVKRLGVNCLIGAGAVVVKDVPDNAVMVGIPAKVLRYQNPPENVE